MRNLVEYLLEQDNELAYSSINCRNQDNANENDHY